jgi:hypothetical protein
MYFNQKNLKNTIKLQQQILRLIFFTRVDLMWNNSIINILLFSQLSQLVEDFHLLLLSKPLEGDMFCLENIDF